MFRLLLIVVVVSVARPIAAQPASPNGVDPGTVAFLVRIENLSNGGTLRLSSGGAVAIPLSSGVWAIHTGDSPMFTPGEVEPGLGLKGLAEAGMARAFVARLGGRPGIRSLGVFSEPLGRVRGMPRRQSGRPASSRMLQRGQHYEFAISARRGDRLSIALMVAQSNDGVIATGPDGIELFDGTARPINGDVTSLLSLWDAGTEVNEDPGVGPNQGLRQGAPHAGDLERKPVRLMSDAEFGERWPPTKKLVRIIISPRR